MKYIKKTLGICLLIIWLAPALTLWADCLAWLLTGHTPIHQHIAIPLAGRIIGTIAYTILAGLASAFLVFLHEES